jgi:hypothetical protein
VTPSTVSLPLSRRSELWLRAIAAMAALTSLGALLTQVFGILPMGSFLTFFGVPSVVLILTLAAMARRINHVVFLRSLSVGLAGGLVATFAYDLFRLGMRETGLFEYDGFRAIYIFGSWIAGSSVDTAPAAIAGWFYHFWNGLSFGLFYALTFGARSWLWGLGYGLVMEAMMLGLFPLFLRITDQVGFIVISLAGHAVYGVVLGLAAQRYAKNW